MRPSTRVWARRLSGGPLMQAIDYADFMFGVGAPSGAYGRSGDALLIYWRLDAPTTSQALYLSVDGGSTWGAQGGGGGGVPTSRTIATTSPLTGGGDLSADRTLGITVGSSGGVQAWSANLDSLSAYTVDPDTALAAGSSTRIPTQAAVKSYVDGAVTGLWQVKGQINCGANPNYPAAWQGDAYAVSVAGRIGGGSGPLVDQGDVIVCVLDNAGGTHASVGASWIIIEHNLAGALISSNDLSDVSSPSAARTNLGLGDAATKNTGTTAGTVAAGDDSRFPTTGQKQALAGSSGTPSSSNTYVTVLDPRLGGLGRIIYGSGTDGAVTLDGATTPAWATRSGSTYTMTRDCYCTDLTINAGVTLKPDGYIITCSGTYTNNGTVDDRGNSASGLTQGGQLGAGGTLNRRGLSGVAGRSSSAAGLHGNSATTTYGGAGGNGGSAGGILVGGTGGSASAPTAGLLALGSPWWLISGARPISSTQTITQTACGAGGASGGLDSSAGTGNSGGGGGGGGHIRIVARIHNNLGTHTVKGGAGGNSTAAGGRIGGGGGGGGGGLIEIYCDQNLASGTNDVTGGTGGTGAGGGTAGSNGSSGTFYLHALT